MAEFRTATERDVDTLVDLVESAYRGDRSRQGWCTEADVIDGQRVDAEMLRTTLTDDEAIILLLEQDDRTVACCELRRIDDDVAALGMFAVDPTSQAGGLGRRVLDAGEQLAVERWGVGRMRLTVIDIRTTLIEWYERRGYCRTGEHQPFPYGDDRFGVPRRDDLRFAVLEKRLPLTPGMVDHHV